MTHVKRIGLISGLVGLLAVAAIAVSGTPAHAGPFPPGNYDYAFYNIVTNKCMDVPGFAGGSVNGPVNQYACDLSGNDNQFFHMDWYGTQARFVIRHVKSGNLCLDLPGWGPVPAGTRVSLYYCQLTPNDNQLFYAYWLSGLYYLYVHEKTGLCLDVDGFATGGNDAPLTLAPCNAGNDDHIWQLW
jgi:hypothetical protein